MQRIINLWLAAAFALLALPALAQDHGCVEPPPNMVLWLPFDEMGGNIAFNAQAGNNGILLGAPLPVRVPQYVARGLCFSGNNFVNVNDYPAINFGPTSPNVPGQGDFSIDAWILPQKGGAAIQRLVDKRFPNAAGKNVGYSLFLAGGKLAAEIGDAGAGASDVFVGPVVPLDGNWHHVAVAFCRSLASAGAGGLAYLYLDGVQFGPFALTQSGDLTNPAPFRVAHSTPPAGNSYFVGCADEIEVFSRCLATSEIVALVQARQAGKCKDMCGICWDQYFDVNRPQFLPIKAKICNKTGVPQTYTFQFSGLPAGGGCINPQPGPTMFAPANGTITVPANSCAYVMTTMTNPWIAYPITSWQVCGPFQVAFKNTTTGNIVTCTSNAWDNRAINHPYPPNGGCDEYATDGNGTMKIPGLTITNPTQQAIFLTLVISVMDPHMKMDTDTVSLNEQPPGPITLDLFLPAVQSVDIPLTAQFRKFDPGRNFTLLIDADLLGDGNLEPLDSALLTNNLPATGATVTGRIALEGVKNLAAISPGAPLDAFSVEFRTPNTTTDVFAASVTLTTTTSGGAFGTYSVSGVPTGAYDVRIKGNKNLAVCVPGVAVSDGSTIPDVTLPAGDANNDNMVDVADFGALVNSYGGSFATAGSGYDPTADFNFDGSDDIADFGLLVSEFGNTGCP